MYLMYSCQGNLMKNQLEKLGQTESVFTSNIEAGNTVTIQRGLLETETREGGYETICWCTDDAELCL